MQRQTSLMKRETIVTIGRWLGLSQEFIAQFLPFTHPRYVTQHKFCLDDCLGWYEMSTVTKRLQYHRYIFENITTRTVVDLYYLSSDEPELVFLILMLMILVENDKYDQTIMNFLDLIYNENLIHYFSHYPHSNSTKYQEGMYQFICHHCEFFVEIDFSSAKYMQIQQENPDLFHSM